MAASAGTGGLEVDSNAASAGIRGFWSPNGREA